MDTFISAIGLPALLRPLALAAFRTWVVGRSLDLDEARMILAELPLESGSVERMPGLPALMLTGRRR